MAGLERELAKEGVWNNPQEAQRINRRFEHMREELSLFETTERKLGERAKVDNKPVAD